MRPRPRAGSFWRLARLQARFLDRVRGIATIVLYGRAADEAAALAQAADELRRRTMRVLRVAFLSSAVLDLAAAAGTGNPGAPLRAADAGHRMASPGTALFALLLVPEFFAPLRGFAAAYQDRLHATGAADELIDLPPAAGAGARPRRAHRGGAGRDGGVRGCPPDLGSDTRPALDGLSFRVPAGETLVLAGPSGAGKSSVIEILLGFVRPDSGRVTVNGADIADLVPEALSRLTAWIGQRPVLFAGSIRDNIRFARPEATDEEVAQAARGGAGDRIRRRPAGWPGHAGRRRRLRPVRRAGAAGGDRPRLPEERAAAAAGRADRASGPGHRGGGAGKPAPAGAGADGDPGQPFVGGA